MKPIQHFPANVRRLEILFTFDWKIHNNEYLQKQYQKAKEIAPPTATLIYIEVQYPGQMAKIIIEK